MEEEDEEEEWEDVDDEVDDDDDPVSVLRLRDDPEDERLNCAAASAVPAE